MNVSSLREAITKSLTETFTLPTKIQRVVKDSHSLKMRIVEGQNKDSVFGFDLALEWRKLSGYLYVDVVHNSKGLAEQWRNNLKDTLDTFLVFSEKLNELGCIVWVKIDDKEVNPRDINILSHSWGLFSVGFSSKYLEVVDGLDYHFENIQPILTSFWAMILSFTSSINDLAEDSAVEGSEKEYLSKKYERNPLNRQACIDAHGSKCSVCGMDFEKKYGNLGYGFIEVHHIQLISSYGGAKKIDPKKDLIPVCSNCHSMLHRQNPPVSPEILREILEKRKENKDD